MKVHWPVAASSLSPVAGMVGPFASPVWLQTWAEHRGTGDLVVAATDESLVALIVSPDGVEFAGDHDVTDYHSPLGSPAVPALVKFIADLPDGLPLSLDSLPEPAATGVASALRDAGHAPTIRQHAITAVLDLPESFDDYLMSIGKKERHELRRKRRRFDAEAGPARLERRSGLEAVSLFARLHRGSAGDKGAFMNDDMEAFFLALHTDAGAVIDVLVDGADRPVSAVFSFEDEEGFYLYNSAYESEARHLSPGNVMLSHLIERSIAAGHTVFDFLKGDEQYKFRLGASERPLYVVEALAGGSR